MFTSLSIAFPPDTKAFSANEEQGVSHFIQQNDPFLSVVTSSSPSLTVPIGATLQPLINDAHKMALFVPTDAQSDPELISIANELNSELQRIGLVPREKPVSHVSESAWSTLPNLQHSNSSSISVKDDPKCIERVIELGLYLRREKEPRKIFQALENCLLFLRNRTQTMSMSPNKISGTLVSCLLLHCSSHLCYSK